MKLIPLTQGKFAKVDDGDYEWLMQYTWHAVKDRKTYYAATARSRKEGGGIIWMHRLIMDTPENEIVDHREMDGEDYGLNNQRSNLRNCSVSKNLQNKRKQSDNTSGFKGVDFHKAARKWRSRIKVNGVRLCLGYFINPVDAARAYDKAAAEHFGEFALLNFPGCDK